MIDTSKLLTKVGNYRFAPSGAVTDRTLLEIATQFENQVSRKMTAITPDQLGKRYATSEPILETTKYDGEAVFISFDQSKGIFAFNAPSGRVRIGLPALEQLKIHLCGQGIQKGLFRAELYLANDGNAAKRPNIADVLRASFNGTAGEVALLKLVMLDIIMLDGKDYRPNQENFTQTWELLEKLFGTDISLPFHRAHGSILPENQLPRVFQEKIKAGEEGLVIRRLQRLDITKVKPHLSIDAVIIGYVEGEFEGKYGITSLLTALSYPEKEDGKLLLQSFCRVGSGFSDQQREEFLATFSALKVSAPLAMTDSDGRTVHFVKPVHIVELHGEDIVSTSSKDKENRSQVFSVDGDQYHFLGLVPFPRLTFATFSRLRPDKTLTGGGARIEQVDPNPQKPQLRKPEANGAEVIRREVYVKNDAVRKLLILKTGNENAVPYVVYWTDYSAKRKEPLKVTTQCAYVESRALALAERLIAENVTKGFTLWTGQPAEAPASAEAAEPPQEPKKRRVAKKKE